MAFDAGVVNATDRSKVPPVGAALPLTATMTLSGEPPVLETRASVGMPLAPFSLARHWPVAGSQPLTTCTDGAQAGVPVGVAVMVAFELAGAVRAGKSCGGPVASPHAGSTWGPLKPFLPVASAEAGSVG